MQSPSGVDLARPTVMMNGRSHHCANASSNSISSFGTYRSVICLPARTVWTSKTGSNGACGRAAHACLSQDFDSSR